jgi:hypothetical protein
VCPGIINVLATPLVGDQARVLCHPAAQEKPKVQVSLPWGVSS